MGQGAQVTRLARMLCGRLCNCRSTADPPVNPAPSSYATLISSCALPCAAAPCELALHPNPAPCRVPHCPRILSLPCTLFLPPPSAPCLCALPLPPPSPPRPVSNSPPYPVRVVCVHKQGRHQQLQQCTQLL